MKKIIIALAVIVCVMLAGFGYAASQDNTAPAGYMVAEPEIDTASAQARVGFLQKYRFDPSVKQVLIISHTTGWNASVSFYEKLDDNDAWSLTFQSDAYIGKNGMGKIKEGDSRTPSGDYEVTGAFGILKNPGTTLDYIDVKQTTFACDENCRYYNQIIDTEQTGHDCHGEPMYQISPEYNYGITIDYNKSNRYPAGSAIFIHCKGPKPYTGGCIALDENDMKTVLMAAEKGMRVYLDEFYIR